MDLGHIVVAKVGARVARVQCLTCRSPHAYHHPRTHGGNDAVRRGNSSRPSSSGPERARAASGAKPRQVGANVAGTARAWEETVARAPADGFRPYKMGESFAAGEFISHPTFGRGAVLNVIPPNKMEVLFQGGARTLAMNRPAG
jgi:hypothetical protein